MPLPSKVTDDFKRRNPKIYDPPTKSPIPHAQPQRDQAPALGSAVSGKAESVQSTTVCFTGYRVRPLDPDNFAGSVKDLLDGLRHAGLIPGDEWWRITLETKQIKVTRYEDECTMIEITT